jgi:hypothetical protein
MALPVSCGSVAENVMNELVGEVSEAWTSQGVRKDSHGYGAERKEQGGFEVHILTTQLIALSPW